MANFREGIHSIYIYHNRSLFFECKSLCMILMNHLKQFVENFFHTSINISFEFYGVK